MTKKLKIYQILTFALGLAFVGLCLFVGITAVQKSMKLNLAVKMNPSITCKINASFDGGESYKEVFSNAEGDTAIGANWLISGNTLTYDNTAEGSMGMTVKLKVQNLTPNTKVMIESLNQVKDVVATNATSSAFDVAIPAGGKVAIDFSQVFAITKGQVNNATITPKSNVYTIDSTYYVKQNEEASFTLTGSGNYDTPAQGAIGLTSGSIKSYSDGTLTLNILTSDTTITINNTTGKTYIVEKGTLTGFEWGAVADNAQFNSDYTFTLVLQDGYKIDGATVQAVITGGDTVACEQTAVSGTTYTFKLAGASITGNVTINATAEEIITSWDEGTHVIYEYGTTGAVDNNRAYYKTGLHYKYYIEMGEYPQTGADSTTEDYLDSNYASLSTDANGYYTYNGAKYARVESPNTSYSADSSVNFYKVEPIRWIVLGGVNDVTSTDSETNEVVFDPSEGNTLTYENKTFIYNGTPYSKVLLIAEQALINTRYDYGDGSSYSSSNTDGYTSDQPWQDTDIYNFLNTGDTSLLNKIFTSTQQGKILGATLVTGCRNAGGSGTAGSVPATSTGNELFLLGGGELAYSGNTNNNYVGYASENYKVATYFTDPTARYGGTSVANVTDYARACGTYCYANSSYNTAGASYWWLRSGSYDDANRACRVDYVGRVGNRSVYYSDVGVRPSFILNLAQAL